jgi:hypothetical protein
MDGLIHLEFRYIYINTLRKIPGKAFYFHIMQRSFQYTPLPHSYGITVYMYGNPGTQKGIPLDFIKIHMEYASIHDIPLGILDKGFMNLSVHINLDYGTFRNALYPVHKILGVQINGNGAALPAIDHRGNAP